MRISVARTRHMHSMRGFCLSEISKEEVRERKEREERKSSEEQRLKRESRHSCLLDFSHS